MADYDTFDEDDTAKNGDDFISMGSDLARRINWKIAAFLFIIGVFVMSDVFIGNILIKCSNCEVDGVATSKGTMIQLFCMSLAYIALDLFLG
jgi:hypothetical protein